jgi:drug/metabolite transporter (DMT)-like permease
MLRTLLLQRHLTHVQAAFYSCFAYLMFSLSDTMAKWFLSEGFERSTIIVANSLPALIILTVLMIKRHGVSRAYHTTYKKLHIVRGLTLIAITYFMFEAVNRLPLTDFYGVIFSTPFIVTIGAFFIFKEKVSITEWIVITIGFAGVLIVVQPDYNDFNLGYLFAFGAVLSVALSTMVVRKIGRDEDPYLYVIFGSIALVLANIIPAIESPLPPTINITHVLAMAFYAFTIPTAVLTLSAVFARAPSIASVAPFQYSQIIWGTLFGYVIFQDIPQINTIIGSAVIIACGLYILLYHQRKRRRELL